MGILICCPTEDEDYEYEKNDNNGGQETSYLFVPDLNSYNGEHNRKKERHGKGVYYYTTGDIYDGDWENDKKHGYGEYRFKDGKVLIGYFEHDEFLGSLPPQQNTKKSKKKKKKSKVENPAQPLWLEDDGLIVSNRAAHESYQNSPSQQHSRQQRRLIDQNVRFDGLTDEERQRKIQEEQLKRENSKRMRERHKETTERIRKKYNLPSQTNSQAV